MTHVRKKRSGLITLTAFLLFSCVIVALCPLFLQNYLIFSPEGVRFEFGTKQTTQSLNVVVSDKNKTGTDLFAPVAAPAVLIEDAVLPPR